MNGKYQFGWIITVLSKDELGLEDGMQIELADLGNGKHMIVATDIVHPIVKDIYRQAGFGPFVLEDHACLDEQVKILKEDLLKRRNHE